MRLRQSSQAFPITPASRVIVDAVNKHGERLLCGTGVDWGTGIGNLAIACALASTEGRIKCIFGLDVVPENIRLARLNGEDNAVSHVCEFHEADSFTPKAADVAQKLSAAVPLDFVVANPPGDHNPGGDSFGWRRRVAREAVALLKKGAPLLLQALSAYGEHRFRAIAAEGSGLRYEGTLHRHGPVPLDLSRPDLRDQLSQYARFEEAGEQPGAAERLYVFEAAEAGGRTRQMDARETLAKFEATGELPLVYWTVQHYTRV